MTPVTTPRDTRMMKEIRATESRPICQEDPKPTAWYVANFALSQPVTMAPRIGGGAPAASLRCKMSHYFGTFTPRVDNIKFSLSRYFIIKFCLFVIFTDADLPANYSRLAQDRPGELFLSGRQCQAEAVYPQLAGPSPYQHLERRRRRGRGRSRRHPDRAR